MQRCVSWISWEASDSTLMAVRQSSLSPFSLCFASAKRFQLSFLGHASKSLLYSRYHFPEKGSKFNNINTSSRVRIPWAILLKIGAKIAKLKISSPRACQWCRLHLPHNENTPKTSLSRLSPDVQNTTTNSPEPALDKIRSFEVSEQRLLLPLWRWVPRKCLIFLPVLHTLTLPKKEWEIFPRFLFHTCETCRCTSLHQHAKICKICHWTLTEQKKINTFLFGWLAIVSTKVYYL